MKVMLVNDDGYGAPGIEAMAEALKNAGHEVLVAAPDGQRSGSGQSVTLDGEVRAVRKPLGWALTGTPADCVRAGLLHLMPDCDMVIFRCRFGTIAHRQEGHSDIALMREGRACMTAVSWDATHAASNAVAEEIAGRMTEK